MQKPLAFLGLLTLLGSAQGQVLGRAIPLAQTGICPVLGCTQMKEVQVSPRIKYVEGQKANPDLVTEAGGGVAAFYVDGKLAALGWQIVFNYDSPNIKLAQVNQLTRIAAGANAPSGLRQYDGLGGLDLEWADRTFKVNNAVLRVATAGDRRGLMLIDQQHYSLISSVIGREDRKVGQALLKDFFAKNGLRAVQLSPYQYRVPFSKQLYSKAQQYFMGMKKMENHACCGHPGLNFTFQGLSATAIDFEPDDRDLPRVIEINIETWN